MSQEQQQSAGSGTEQEEEVVEKAEYSIDDAVKPITDVTLAPFEPIDSLLYRKERKLELRLPKTIEDEIRKVIKIENLFIRQPVYPINVYREIPLNVGEFNKKYRNVKDWKIEIYDSWGNKLKEYSGKGKLPDFVYWDGPPPSECIYWHVVDEEGKYVGKGFYYYEFIVRTEDGKIYKRRGGLVNVRKGVKGI